MERIKLISIKDYMNYWELSRKTAAHLYNSDIIELINSCNPNRNIIVNGKITTVGFKFLYGCDFIFV